MSKVTYNLLIYYIDGFCMLKCAILYKKIKEDFLMMKKAKSFFMKHACSVATLMLTGVITGLASRGCYFVYYQPEAPENLHKFSKNK